MDSLYESINKQLGTEYSSEDIDEYLQLAKSLIDRDYLNTIKREDYMQQFKGSVYVTKYYPVLTENISCTVNNLNITPVYVSKEGVIYFDHEYEGRLKCGYVTGINENETNDILKPVIVALIKEDAGKGKISSINEGDVSISYDNSNSTTSSLDALISRAKNKYLARMRII